MTRRLATMYLVTMLLVAAGSPAIPAQDTERTRRSLRGISAVEVLVEDLPKGAKVLGLTKESIQTDVELKLRLAGIRVMTSEEIRMIPGMPELYVEVTLTSNAGASYVAVELNQNVILERDGLPVVGVSTWDTSGIGLNLDAQDIRNSIKDRVDRFLNAWLSVNPKK